MVDAIFGISHIPGLHHINLTPHAKRLRRGKAAQELTIQIARDARTMTSKAQGMITHFLKGIPVITHVEKREDK